MLDKERKRQAYLDEQMSVDEVIDFEASLDADEQRLIQKERLYNESLRNEFVQAPGCPDELWAKLKRQMQAEAPVKIDQDDPAEQIAEIKTFPFDWKLIALAALFLINIISLVALFNQKSQVEVPLLAQQSHLIPHEDLLQVKLENFADHSNKLDGFDSLRKSFEDNNIHLAVNAPTGHHKIRPLGIRHINIAGNKVVELYVDCCDEPTLVLIVPKKHKVDLPNDLRFKSASTTVDDYQILTFSDKHPTSEVNDLFTKR